MNLSELRWQNKPDGTYLAVNSEEKTSLLTFSIEDELTKMGYMNIDFGRLRAVIGAARDTYEFIGPRLQLFDRRKTEFIAIDIKNHKVYLEILKGVAEAELEISAKDIEFLLKQRRVTHGIDWSLINQVIQRKKFGEEFEIAKDTPPQKGEDARLIELVKLDRNSAPLLMADGNVDFRNLDNITHVQEGQVLARRIPPKAGIPGTDIYGQPIPADSGEDLTLPIGKNTVGRNDHTELVSTADGYLYAEENLFCVGKLYLVQGDLNYKTGNIRYKGDVFIRGSVQADFLVEADGDITVEGSVEAATLKASGNITIKAGVFGKGKALVQAGGDIMINQGQDATFIAGKSFKFSNIISDSVIEATSIKSFSMSAVMQGCRARVTELVSVAQIGSQSSNPTEVIFHDPKADEIQAQIQDSYNKKTQMQQQLEAYGKQLKNMKSMLSKAEEITPRMQEEVKKVFLLFQSSQTKIDLLDKKMASLNQTLKQASHFKAQLNAKLVFPILKIQMLDQNLEVKDSFQDTSFRWSNFNIVHESCNYINIVQSMRQS